MNKSQKPAGQAATPLARTPEILSSLGQAAYEWSIGADLLEWSGSAAEIIGVGDPARIATGRAYAALLDPDGPAGRYDTILEGGAADAGTGVPYQIEYCLLPAGPNGPRLWIEDCGRWYAGPDGRPGHAHGVIRPINSRREQVQRLTRLARYDPATGFFNRTHLLDTLGAEIEQALRLRSSIAFLIVGVDNLATVDDSYGFGVGDQVVAGVAQRIQTQLRGGDVIGRFTGNKIGLILKDCDDGQMRVAAERFLNTVRSNVVETDAGPVAVTASIGGVVLPRHARSVAEAIGRAQEGIHHARGRGRGHFAPYVHSAEREELRRSNAAISTELVAALNDRRLTLAYQPIVRVSDMQPAFHEALLRLRRADGSVMPANHFIATAERLGLLRLLDHRTLELAVELVDRRAGARLSLNVSAATTGEPGWLSFLAGAVGRRPDLAGRLIVEITESAAVDNLQEASRFVAAVREIGCRVAIDDFGAGYTSFRNLRDLKVDIIKIDGAYVRGLAASRHDQVFVRALVELARDLGAETVAEMVQDDESAGMLASWGVTYLQGALTGGATLDEPGEDSRRLAVAQGA